MHLIRIKDRSDTGSIYKAGSNSSYRPEVTMHGKHIPRLLFLFFILGLCNLDLRAQTTLSPELDAYAERVLKEFSVPGMAVAVVKDGKVVVSKGYGVRKMGESTPLDEHTLFGIASNTKAFTAAALAILADEGNLNWDDPVIRHSVGV
jgi:CubicO group peptidase (beta-lactamase class C family)